jgi:hypothetical protein
VWRYDFLVRASCSSRRSLSAGSSVSGGAISLATASAGYTALADTGGVAVAIEGLLRMMRRGFVKLFT